MVNLDSLLSTARCVSTRQRVTMYGNASPSCSQRAVAEHPAEAGIHAADMQPRQHASHAEKMWPT